MFLLTIVPRRFQTSEQIIDMTRLPIKWLLLALVYVTSGNMATWLYCPIKSPLEEKIHILDVVNQLYQQLTLTQCALVCMSSSTGYIPCRYFNYNSTSMDCSLFVNNITRYGVDSTTVAYQVGLVRKC
jgi:PAN domain